MQFRFWLNLDKDDEYELAETIDGLKRERRFVTTIREGIRVVSALRAGEWDHVFSMFPAFGDYVDKLILQAKVEAYERQTIQIIQQQAQAIVVEHPDPPPAGPCPMQLPAQAPPPPVFDDEDAAIELDIRATQGGDSAQNFVDSLMRIT
jgi:hypothetical protein